MERAHPTRRLGYQPSLDGLRAVALLGVVAYHAGIADFRGGFLGVSTFFTLSGFLITSLLLTEHTDTGRIALGSFWTRRVRRLLPASMAAIVATVLFAAWIADDSQLSRLRVDGLSSLFHFSNWRFITEGDSYGALFQSPSFFRHFWSLAVEEQYYVVFPLLIAAALRVLGGPGRRFVVAIIAASAFALVWPAVLLARGASTDRLYFGTDTRFGELIVGGVLALWWVRRNRTFPGSTWAANTVGVASLVVLASMWTTATPDDEYLYRGGLAFHAALTAAVIVAAVAPSGPIRTVLAWEPLRRLGVVSYGAYLIHWPVLLWLQQDSSLRPVARFAVGMVVTIALAALSHRFLETPIRGLSAGSARRLVWVVIPASLVTALLVIGVALWREPSVAPIDFAEAETVFENLPDAAVVPVTTDPPTDAESGGPVRLAAFGDSTALMTGIGILHYAEANPEQLTVVQGVAKLGCGLVSGGTRRLEGREVDVPDDCNDWLAAWPAAIESGRVDVAMIQLGAWEIVDHRLEAGGPFLAIGSDPDYEAMQLAELDTVVQALLRHTDVVALVAHPDVGRGRLDPLPAGAEYAEYDPSRSARWRQIVEEYADAHADVIVIDLAGWIAGRDDDLRLRPDGVHFMTTTSDEVAQWLVPEILGADRSS